MSVIYSPSEVAQVLRINEETVRRAIRNKQLTALRIGDQYRLSPTDLGQWIGMDRYLELFRPLEDAVRVHLRSDVAIGTCACSVRVA